MVMDENALDKIMDQIPDNLQNVEVASLLATIAAAFSEGKDVNAAMHLNTAAAMVLSKIMHESRTFN